MDPRTKSELVPKAYFQDYVLIERLGGGVYAQVYSARNSLTKKEVALKRIENVFKDTIFAKNFYREIVLLSALRGHPNIVTLEEVTPCSEFLSQSNSFNLIFNRKGGSLDRILGSKQLLEEDHIAFFLFQIFCGLKYCHSAEVIHRDLKPANLLIDEDCVLQIADFGFARMRYVIEALEKEVIPPKESKESSPTPPRKLTEHVVTRSYRAPEIALCSAYDTAADLWSVGCILAELLQMLPTSKVFYKNRGPLFRGDYNGTNSPPTDESKSGVDQIFSVLSILGTPSREDQAHLSEEAKKFLKGYPTRQRKKLSTLFSYAPPLAIDLLENLLVFNPKKRLSAAQALNHPFLIKYRNDPEKNMTFPLPNTPLKNIKGELTALGKMLVDYYRFELYRWKETDLQATLRSLIVAEVEKYLPSIKEPSFEEEKQIKEKESIPEKSLAPQLEESLQEIPHTSPQTAPKTAPTQMERSKSEAEAKTKTKFQPTLAATPLPPQVSTPSEGGFFSPKTPPQSPALKPKGELRKENPCLIC